jgi:type VI secretion system protein ImpK
MSGKDDPFGPGGKTVIMPKPGGMPKREGGVPPVQPVPPVSGAPRRPPPGQATVIAPAFPPQPPPTAPGSSWPEPASAHGMPLPSQDDWMKGRPHMRPPSHILPDADRPPSGQPVQRIPLEVALNARDGVEFSAANPLTAAAAPLLILLGRLRLQIVDMQAVPLMQHVARSIIDFEKKALEAGIPPGDVTVAKYALCATADDIVQNLPGTDRHVWMQYSMLAQFFQVRTSGVGFFEELRKILANPAPHYHLLELMHACLSLGFEGQYRGAAGGDVELQRVRRDVYQTLRHLRARNDEDISPRWRGLALGVRDLGAGVPLWVIASVAGVALVATFFLLRFLLSQDAEVVSQRLAALHPAAGITIGRDAFVPFTEELFDPNTTQLQRIRDALSDEIAQGKIAVEPVGDYIMMRLNNLVLFDSGKAEVKPEFEPMALKVAEALDKEPGPILVIGHTDNVKPSSTARFKSNHDLSVARAKSVEQILAKGLADPGRLVVEGKGEDEPIADNATAEGRALNRRVEIMIPKEETL